MAQVIISEWDRKYLTHVAYCLTIIPFAYWPIKAHIVKGCLDANLKFLPVVKCHKKVFLSRQEFNTLLKADPAGMNAFNFESQDLSHLIKRKLRAEKRREDGNHSTASSSIYPGLDLS